MTPDELLRHLESLLFVSPEPAEISQLAAALDVPVADLEPAIEELSERCKWRGIRVQRKGQRVQLASAPDAAAFVERYLGLNAVTRLSQAALETLAIIAYRQPITRPEIEVLRGVDCDGVLRTLTARQLITEVGRLDTVGHPIRYGTTFEFLRYFGLERLDQLPSLSFTEPAASGALPPSGAPVAPPSTGSEPEERLTDEQQDSPGPEAPNQADYENRQPIAAHAGVDFGQTEVAPVVTDWDADIAPLPAVLVADTGSTGAPSHVSTAEAGDARSPAQGSAEESHAAGPARPEPVEAPAALGHAEPAEAPAALRHVEPEPAQPPPGPTLDSSVHDPEHPSEPPVVGAVRDEAAAPDVAQSHVEPQYRPEPPDVGAVRHAAVPPGHAEPEPFRPPADPSPQPGPAGEPESPAEPRAGVSR